MRGRARERAGGTPPEAGVRALAAEIEARAFEAWPAAEVVLHEGWRLRCNGGVTQRANSVWPNLLEGTRPVGERIERAEAFYRARGLPAKFQLSPAARPGDLDARLAARGYRVGTRVSIQTVDPRDVAGPAPPGVATEVDETLGEDWFAISGLRGRFAGDAVAVYRDLLGRAREAPAHALARLGGEPVGVALGVAGGTWVGVFALLTLPGARRRGVGSALLRALADWSLRRGARGLYLQVEADNAAARALFAGHGFAPRYAYQYRVRAV